MSVPTVDRAVATKIAEENIAKLSNDELELRLFSEQTIEREFGWVFFYGPRRRAYRLSCEEVEDQRCEPKGVVESVNGKIKSLQMKLWLYFTR